MIRAMVRRLGLATLLGLVFSAAIPAANQHSTAIRITGERRISFNENWRFYKGDVKGAENPSLDDAQWSQVRLPHDWAIEGPFDPNLNPHTGALPISGTGWYRKTFLLTENAKERYFTIVFDGAMSNTTVWLNGHELGKRPYGYASFAFDLTAYLNYGREANVLAVRLAPEEHSSRWYPGAGIYRNVWLDVTGPIHVAEWGTYVTTPEVSGEKATVSVKTEISNRLNKDAQIVLRTSVPELTLSQPERWDLDHPYFYTLVSEVLDGGQVGDKSSTPFGVRTIAFDKEKGFVLNGKQVKLHGVCMHHDLGALGAAVSRRATERQLEILKEAGVNAVRTSHNPPSPELLEYCDRLGIVVMDESFDMWRIPKVENGYSKYFDEWSERDVRDMVRRDRNHPSVILWSIGNEIPEQKLAEGWKDAKRLVGFFHEEDPTRPTTSGFNEWPEAIQNHMAEQVDIPGFNYKPMRYEQIMKEHPNWIIYGSETASCVSSRGVYQFPIEKYEKDPSRQLTSYDVIAPPWAYCPDVEFKYQDQFPNVLGEFVWTGFDYIGEPTPYFDHHGNDDRDWPARSSYFGMVDLAGFPKDRFYLYQSQWTREPMVHILPHWNWKGHEGKSIPVMAYTNAEEVELFLNGKSLGKKKRFSEPVDIPVGPNVSSDLNFYSKYRLEWQVPYEAGELKAVAYSGGKQVAADEVRTAGAPVKIILQPDRNVIQADGDDLSFVTVRIEDKDGNLCPMADNLVHFSVSGAGDIAAVDNGNAATVEPFHADHRTTFNGLALLIVRSKPEQDGKIHVVASGDGLNQGEADITAGQVRQAAAQ